MNRSFRITRTLLILTLIGAMVVAGLAMRAERLSTTGLGQASKEGLFWSAVQVEVELSRFTSALGRHAVDRDAMTAAEVNERFDILWSRVALFGQGSVGERLLLLDDAGAVAELFTAMQASEEQILAIAEQPPETALALLTEFTAFADPLRALSIRVIRSEEDRLAAARADFRHSSFLSLVATAAVLSIVALLGTVLFVESRRYRAMAEESAALAAAAEAASQLKSRFLTMMSHELRTPMNGVMGMLALIRQTPLNDPQARLVDQAHRSGSQMVTLLDDMLDLSDLQSDRQSLSVAAFAPETLGTALAGHLAKRIERAGLGFSTEVAPGTPRQVAGDFSRLRQVVTHLATHLIDIVGTPELVLRLRFEESRLVLDLDAAVHGADEAGWQPEEMLSRSFDAYHSFASDALAPMIAQGLVGLMDGTIDICRPRPGRASVVVAVPVRVVEMAQRLVRIDVAAPTLLAVLTALCRGEDWRILIPGETNGEAGATDAVFFSSDGREEAEAVPRLRRLHPRAGIVAVGRPQHPELFDAICELPLTGERLRRAIDCGHAGRAAS